MNKDWALFSSVVIAISSIDHCISASINDFLLMKYLHSLSSGTITQRLSRSWYEKMHTWMNTYVLFVFLHIFLTLSQTLNVNWNVGKSLQQKESVWSRV